MKGQRSPITTHVLDLATGRPKEGIRISLRVKEKEGKGGDVWRELVRGVTDSDGRAENLLPAAVRVEPGTYSLTFDIGAGPSPSSPSKKSSSSSSLSPFFPEITVVFEVTDSSAHTHVPLLLSPYGYSTYRGS